MTKDNSKMIERLNSVVVTSEELSKVLDEADKLHKSGNDEPGGGLYLIASMFKGQPLRAQAIYFRMESLAKIIGNKSVPGWTLEKDENGAVVTRQELIDVSAVFPLSEVDGDIGFEENGFLSKALELAESEGTG